MTTLGNTESCRNIKGLLGPRTPGFALQISSILQQHTLKFISNPIAKIDSQVDLLLRDTCKIASADITRLYLMDPNLNQLSLAREATPSDPGERQPTGVSINEPNWFFDQAKECGVIYLNQEDTETLEPHRVKRALDGLECRNFLGIPVYYDGEPRGLVTISRNDTTVWTLDHLDALEQVAEILFHVWLRKIAQAHEPVEKETRELYVERWKSYLEHSPDTVAVIDSEGHILDINRTFLVPKQEILGQPIFHFLPPAEHAGTQVRLGVVFEDGQSVTYETQSQRDDGTIRWYCNRISPLFRNDNVVNALLVSTDITDRKSAESNLRESLAHKLQHTEKMRAVGTLAGGIAHSFNNLFWVISGNLELFQREKSLLPNQIHRLEDMSAAVRRAETLIDQLLKFSRQDEGEQFPTLLLPLVNKWIQLCHEIYPDTVDIQLKVLNDALPFVVNIDPNQLQHAFINIATNAYEAMGGGGTLVISLGIEAASGEEPSVTLSIKDSGPGIPAEFLSQIFQPFFTGKGVHQGVGLGLSTAQGIVTASGGHLSIESVPKEGTTVIIRLPYCDKPTHGVEPSFLREPITGTHLLVVDDEASITGMLHAQLSTLGYEVTPCTDSREALKLFQQNPGHYSLAILDEGLPEISGTELAKQLHKMEPHLPIILVTGYSSQINQTNYSEFGVQRFLLKPIPLEVLNTTIVEILTEQS